MGITFTSEQKKVIDLRDTDILVSAAAGSGKTAVLTERIANKICDKNNPAHIDRMLIVTFTKAAAAEMRVRIGKRLREKLVEDPSNTHLRRQIAILHTAQITTIDSFCLYILKNHFEEIGLDPSFVPASEEDTAFLSDKAFDVVTEELLAEGNEEFIRIVECYAPKGNYSMLKEIITGLAGRADSKSYPFDWIHSLILNEANEDKMPFLEYITEYENELLKDALADANKVKALTTGTGLAKHYEGACEDISLLESLIDGDFERRTRLLRAYERNKLQYGAKKFDDASLEVKEEATYLLKRERNIIDDLLNNYHYEDYESARVGIKESIRLNNSLLNLLEKYMSKFSELKAEAGVIDFGDMEHYALDILIKKEGDKYLPTDVALAYRDYFEEIMIDEYQDSNDVQEMILSAVSREKEAKGNRFMVGDVKQSIYGFRLARPEIFIEKYDLFSKNPQYGTKIDLSQNFRSRAEVVDAVNAVFEKCMQKEVGGVDYTDEARLVRGAKYEQSESDYKAEFLYFNPKEKESAVKDTQYEAEMVAHRISELVEEHYQVSEENGLRDIKYSDIVILLRATKGKDTIYKEALKQMGIPAYIVSKSGYYSATEVQLILNFLSVIDNPRQDMPLFAVMRSLFGDFSDEEIAKIRIGSKKKRFYDSVVQYIVGGDDNELVNKVSSFVTLIDEYRKKALYKSATEMITDIYDRFDYVAMMLSLPGGEQRLANIKLLLDTAAEYEAGGLFNLHEFIRHIDSLKKREVDIGEANILDENANVVRIMTIHKSKGLEYPVCFVSGMGSLNKSVRGTVLIDDEFGIGGEIFNLEKRTKCDSLVKNVIKSKQQIKERGEDIRVLYVALTRAKEKLIITGAVNEENMSSSSDFSTSDIAGFKRFSELLYPIAINNKQAFNVRKYSLDVNEAAGFGEVDREARKKMLYKDIEVREFKPFCYPNSDLSGLFTKTTVSELKKAAYLEREDGDNSLYHDEEKKIPGFIEERNVGIGGAERGTAYHRVMELMDFEGIYDGDVVENLRNHRKKTVEDLYIEEQSDALVYEQKILDFLSTDLSHRMSEAAKKEKLYLEQPFVLAVDADKVREEFPSDEKILVQGVIDVYFEEDGELVLMDYKTDRVNSGEELIARYKTQLDYYSEALSRLEKKRVKQILIYSFSLGEVIEVK